MNRYSVGTTKGVFPHPNGQWVKYIEVQSLRAELAAMREQVRMRFTTETPVIGQKILVKLYDNQFRSEIFYEGKFVNYHGLVAGWWPLSLLQPEKPADAGRS